VSWKPVFPGQHLRVAVVGHKSSMASLALYAPLQPATGLLHRWFGHRPAVVMLAGGIEPLHELRLESAIICLR
jgi:hypothetical protein